MKLALFGGIYNNYLALKAAIEDANLRGVDATYCLGDLGAFGPHPDRVFPLLQDNNVLVVQGNYDHSIGHELDDCQCGYTDPRDNEFAQISFDYTLRNTSEDNRRWLQTLPGEYRFTVEGKRILLCHGSPRRTNEFLWESTTSTHFLDKLADENDADVIFGTHTGLHWQRKLSRGRLFVNVGVLGRPENDGTTNVWYTIAEVKSDDVIIEFVPLHYDHQRLAKEMQRESIPHEFIDTILTGWWTTCLEVLPGRERRAGRF